jgi:hypothetical protein
MPFLNVNRSPGYAAIAASSAACPTATLDDAAMAQRMCGRADPPRFDAAIPRLANADVANFNTGEQAGE